MDRTLTPQSHRSRLLTECENDIVAGLLPSSCENVSTAIIQLFLTDPPDHSQWRKVTCGVACFIRNQELQAFFIHIYNTLTFELVWEQEMYNELQYRVHAVGEGGRALFHTFEADNCMAGLNFADEAEADHFYDKVLIQQRRTLTERRRASTQTGSPGGNQSTSPAPASQLPDTLSTFRPSGFQFLSTNAKKRTLTAPEIGQPVAGSLQRITQLGCHAERVRRNYDLKNPIIAQLLSEAGKDPATIDKETEELVSDALDNLGGMEALGAAMTGHRPYLSLSSSLMTTDSTPVSPSVTSQPSTSNPDRGFTRSSSVSFNNLPGVLTNRFSSMRVNKPAGARRVLPPLPPARRTTTDTPQELEEAGVSLPFRPDDIREALRLQREYDCQRAVNNESNTDSSEIAVPAQRRATGRKMQQEESDDRKCCVCLDEDKCMLLRPCNHVPVCSSCAGQLVVCPVCRARIREMEKVFI